MGFLDNGGIALAHLANGFIGGWNSAQDRELKREMIAAEQKRQAMLDGFTRREMEWKEQDREQQQRMAQANAQLAANPRLLSTLGSGQYGPHLPGQGLNNMPSAEAIWKARELTAQKPVELAPGLKEFVQIYGRKPDSANEYLAFLRGKRGPGTSVTVNTGESPDSRPIVDKPSKDYQRIWDEGEKTWRDKAIPGTAAAAKEAKGEEAAINKGIVTQRYADVVVEDIDRAVKLVEGADISPTGLYAAGTAWVPGTTAHDLEKLIGTIKANAGFDKLQQMRDSSPTGGALGQVSEREINFLQAAIGNLDLSQGRDQFLFNLQRVKRIYQDIIHGPTNPQVDAQPKADPVRIR